MSEEAGEERRTPGSGADVAPASKSGGAPGRRGPWPVVVGVLLAVILGLYIWKLLEVSDVRGDAAAARDSLQARSMRALDERTHELLRLSVVPLGWAVRTEMLRRDLGRVDAFLAEFVQEPGVRRAVVGGPGDSILVSTDKSLEGKAFSDHFPAELLRLSEPTVGEPDPATGYRIAVPILGPTRSLGVLVVDYRPPPPPPESSAPGSAEPEAGAPGTGPDPADEAEEPGASGTDSV